MWSSGIGATSNRGDWLRERSISVSATFAGFEAADCGLLSSDLAAGIRRVKGLKKNGIRLGNWLTADQARSLWQAPDTDRMRGKRDRALLALMLACGLRRHEAVTLRAEDLQQREEHWAIVRSQSTSVTQAPPP